MRQYEYKTIALNYGHGILKRKDPDLDEALNNEAKEGWRVRQIVVPAKELGQSEKFLVLLERERE